VSLQSNAQLHVAFEENDMAKGKVNLSSLVMALF